MKPIKKITSLCLCVVLVLTLLPAAALAVQTYTTSPSGVAMIEKFEGFRNMPYSDDKGNWYIGYGSQCNPADYPFGITEAQADVLLRQDLASKEEAVNRLLVDYNISVTQYQFDAMVSMTYTLGTRWMNPTYRFCGYLIRGIQNYSEVEVVNAIATWCHSGDDPLDHLVERRPGRPRCGCGINQNAQRAAGRGNSSRWQTSGWTPGRCSPAPRPAPGRTRSCQRPDRP